jgi:hypothetical protein
MFLLLAACASTPGEMWSKPASTLTNGWDTALDDSAGDSADTDTDTDTDTDSDTDTDTDTDTDADTDADPTYEVCWLGSDRSGRTCVPTVPYSSSFGDDYDYPPKYGGSDQYRAPVRYVDLDTVSEDLAIAPNFVLSEYMAAYKGQWGVLQGHHVEELQSIRDAIGGPLTVTSGYRCPGYNAGVGGVTYSRHQYGDASDLDASGWSVEELGVVCDDLGADYVGLYEDGHTHCDWRDATLDTSYWPASARVGEAADRGVPSSAILRHIGAVWTAPAEGFDEGEPFRRWTAMDGDGGVITSTDGRAFVAPAGTWRVRVVVGGACARWWQREAVARGGGWRWSTEAVGRARRTSAPTFLFQQSWWARALAAPPCLLPFPTTVR